MEELFARKLEQIIKEKDSKIAVLEGQLISLEAECRKKLDCEKKEKKKLRDKVHYKNQRTKCRSATKIHFILLI